MHNGDMNSAFLMDTLTVPSDTEDEEGSERYINVVNETNETDY